METVLDYVVQGNTAQFNNPAFMEELQSWIRFNDQEATRTGDGLSGWATGNPPIPRWLRTLLSEVLLYNSAHITHLWLKAMVSLTDRFSLPMARSSDLRRFAALAALVGWFALAAQFYLSVQLGIANGNGVLGGVVSFFSYFTILTNGLGAIALTAGAMPERTTPPWLRFFRRPGVVTAITASMVVVGSVYFWVLRHIWAPQGLQWLADVLLHYAMPPLVLVYWWWAVPKDQLHPVSIFRWTLYPLAYAVYALVMGAIRGRYPYPFIDVIALGHARVLGNAAVILAVFAALCLALIWLGRLDQRRSASPRLG